jgi:uncharacterized membrane protein YvlD (DUF360 family)
MNAFKFTTRDLAFVAIAAALWAVLNATISPIFWQATHLPILCDMLGLSMFAITAWWVRKPGSVTMMGGVATLIYFMMMPGGTQFLGFTAAAVFFDVAASIVGYSRCCGEGKTGMACILALSVISAFIAGMIIANIFMAAAYLAGYGGAFAFALIHAGGGAIGGALGITLIQGLKRRGMEGGRN